MADLIAVLLMIGAYVGLPILIGGIVLIFLGQILLPPFIFILRLLGAAYVLLGGRA